MALEIDLSDYLTRSQAGRELGRSGEAVSRAARLGRLPFVDTPYGRLFRRDDLERYRREVLGRRERAERETEKRPA